MKASNKIRSDHPKRGDRLSLMAEACRRISQSLDQRVVLQEIIDSSRTLTGARYGALVAFDSHGAIEEFLTSGMTNDEQQRLRELPKGLGLLGYLNEVREPLRLRDLANHPRSIGFPEGHPPMRTFLGVPIRHLGDAVGNIYLTEKEGGREFTQEDEDTLVLFASQAAVVINNARTYEQERRAKADLEGLINISPVGVLVFDAKSGDLLSRNEETRRIVGKLNAPGRSQSELFEVMTLRTVDGHDIPSDELPTSKALRSGETVLAEEVVIHLPDGRAIHTLVNARPIYGQSGDAVSVVTTMQDITPLEELKRQRSEFLSRVSQELRTPLTSIKGSAATVLNSPDTPNPTEVLQFLRIIDEQADHMRRLINDLVDLTETETGTLSVNPEPTDVEYLAEHARNACTDQDRTLDIEVELASDLPRIMADRRRVSQVLVNFIVGASVHSQSIKLKAMLDDPYVAFTIESMRSENFVDHPGFSLHGASRTGGEDVGTEKGTSGLNPVICKGIVEAHGGRMSAEVGGPGQGTRFGFTIPTVDENEYSTANLSASDSDRSRTPDGDKARILVVGGDYDGRRFIRSVLSSAGFIPLVTDAPDNIERLIEIENPHVALVEATLSWTEWSELMEGIRRISDSPVIFVSGHGGEENIERAFELGAADYLAKPFTPTELVARTNAALRRRQSPIVGAPSKPFVLEDLTIDYVQRSVTLAGIPVQLTATEYKLLYELSNAASQVLTYEQLLRRAWGPLHSTDERIVHTYVKQLRSKLGDDARQPRYIFTEPRVGYHMAKPAADRPL